MTKTRTIARMRYEIRRNRRIVIWLMRGYIVVVVCVLGTIAGAASYHFAQHKAASAAAPYAATCWNATDDDSVIAKVTVHQRGICGPAQINLVAGGMTLLPASGPPAQFTGTTATVEECVIQHGTTDVTVYAFLHSTGGDTALANAAAFCAAEGE